MILVLSDEERKAKAKEYRDRPENKAKFKEYRDSIRLKILQHYSKALSNSDIPCCRCCGEDSHTHFLALDHIAGRKEMDSEPELVKLGYSSSLMLGTLQTWIIKNNFPKGFQILCHNCNSAKGFYGKCPHETFLITRQLTKHMNHKSQDQQSGLNQFHEAKTLCHQVFGRLTKKRFSRITVKDLQNIGIRTLLRDSMH